MSSEDVTVNQVLVKWLESQPNWYSFALHMALQGQPTKSELESLVTVACEEQGTEVDGIIALKPYTPDDLASAGIANREVLLEEVTATSGINAIVSGEKLSVATKGLTVVYGKNGSGKSGFSRLIRNASTSRSGPAKILPNVFEDNGMPVAEIKAYVDGESEVYSWNQANAEYPAVPEVAFFDSECAAMEVGSKDNALLYTPKIIQALMRLSRIITEVGEAIQARADVLVPSLTAQLAPMEVRNHELIAAALECKTRKESDEITSKAELSQEEQTRLAALPQIIASDPSAELPKYRRRSEQLSGIRDKLATLYQCCQPSFMKSYENAISEKKAADEAADAARNLLDENSNLDGIGTEAWKSLWQSAREYSQGFAYPTIKFPPNVTGSLCPLCQQPLDSEAIARMATFESYVSGAAEKTVNEKQNALNEVTRRFMDAVASVREEKGAIGILEAEDASEAMNRLIQKLDKVTGVMDDQFMTDLSEMVTTVDTYVRGEIDLLAKRISAAEDTLQPGKVKQLNEELAQLRSRNWIFSERELIAEDATKRERKQRLLAFKKKCNTRAVSQLVSTVSKMEIIERMEAAFSEELARLGASNQRVAISTRAKAGREVQSISLDGATATTTNVLSEGEQKIVALAGFFALLDVLPGKSTTVLDDPITSLDHLWRKLVAKRIVEEAQNRPVVVFTHEPVFCSELTDLSVHSGVPIEYRTVTKMGSATGMVIDGLSWDASTAEQRIKGLHRDADELRRKVKSGAIATDEELAHELYRCYSKLRSTWERAVEAVLLAGVVERMQRPVHTMKLKQIVIEDDDIRLVDENMDKCSLLTEAHDDPLVAPDVTPTIEEFESDVKVLSEWIDSVKKRQKAHKKKG